MFLYVGESPDKTCQNIYNNHLTSPKQLCQFRQIQIMPIFKINSVNILTFKLNLDLFSISGTYFRFNRWNRTT